jgi:hypothetical protein
MPEKKVEKDMAVFTGTVKGLTEEQIQELKRKFGLEIRIRSTSDTITSAIAKIQRDSSYDRTYPGYDRSYDKSGASEIAFANPVINPEDLNKPG